MADAKVTAIKSSRPARKPVAKVAAPKPPAPPRRKTLLQALATGDELAELEALRDLAAKKLADPKTPARDFGTISKQLREYSAQLAALKARPDGGDGSGEEGAPDGGSVPDAPLDPDSL